jgi:hypothetical protein
MPAQTFITITVDGKKQRVAALSESEGIADGGKIVATASDGRIDPSLMPNGIEGLTKILPASESLSAGDLVNIFFDASANENAGGWFVRKASGANAARYAVGFVENNFAANAAATVYFSGEIDIDSETAEQVYLTSTPGVAGAYNESDTNLVIHQLVGRITGEGKYAFIQGEVTLL